MEPSTHLVIRTVDEQVIDIIVYDTILRTWERRLRVKRPTFQCLSTVRCERLDEFQVEKRLITAHCTKQQERRDWVRTDATRHIQAEQNK